MRISRAVDWLTDGAAFIGAWAIMPLTAIMTYEVFSRYVLNEPTIWAFELSWMLMGVISIMGMAYALRRDEHVRVDLFYGMYARRKKAFVNIVGYLLLLPCMLLVAIHMTQYAMEAYRSGEVSGASAWNPVLWPFRVALAVGLIVFVAQIILEFARCVRTLVSRFFGASTDV